MSAAFERHLLEALARGFRAKHAEQLGKVKTTRDEHTFEDGRKSTFEVMTPESVVARRNADALDRLAAAFEHDAEQETKRCL